MVISQSVGGGRLPGGISPSIAKRVIRKIIDDNPAIRASVNTLVAHSTEPKLPKKREKAILAVYKNNEVFKTLVDAKLHP